MNISSTGKIVDFHTGLVNTSEYVVNFNKLVQKLRMNLLISVSYWPISHDLSYGFMNFIELGLQYNVWID